MDLFGSPLDEESGPREVPIGERDAIRQRFPCDFFLTPARSYSANTALAITMR